MKTVFVSEPIHVDGIARLEAAGVRVIQGQGQTALETAAAVTQANAMIVRTFAVNSDVLARANNLVVVAKHGVGCDNIDVTQCTARGIPVMITAEANKISVAEQTLMFMLALAKDVTWYDREVREGRWTSRHAMRAVDLAGRTALIVGFGRIGKEVAARARAFGMRVIVADIALDHTRATELGCETADDFRRHLSEADVLTVHVPKTPATNGFIARAELAALKRGAIVVNCARGGIIEEAALADALAQGHVAAAGLDVFDVEPVPVTHPLLAFPNVLISPHSAASTAEGGRRMAVDAAQNVLAALDGRIIESNLFNPELRAAARGPEGRPKARN